MVMTMRSMYMTVRNFFRAGFPDLDHMQRETQGHPGQRVVAIEDHLAISDISHGKYPHVIA